MNARHALQAMGAVVGRETRNFARQPGRLFSALVRPLVEALRRYVLAPGKVHADDTPMPVLAPGNGQTKTGRLWVYVSRGTGYWGPPKRFGAPSEITQVRLIPGKFIRPFQPLNLCLSVRPRY